jgi:hypothetical protein
LNQYVDETFAKLESSHNYFFHGAYSLYFYFLRNSRHVVRWNCCRKIGIGIGGLQLEKVTLYALYFPVKEGKEKKEGHSDFTSLCWFTALRRYEAAGWLRKTAGVVGGKDLPAEPSEEEFRFGLRSGIILCTVLNKIQPGAVPKVSFSPVFILLCFGG